jgi:DNA-directed RNA polymerase beta' subunit
MDLEPYIERYTCVCGSQKGAIYDGIECPICKTKTKFVGDRFDIYGWIRLDDYYIIHPNIFSILQSFIGTENLDVILFIEDEKDVDGFSKSPKKRKIKTNKQKIEKLKKENPFAGIGMIEFKERFDEIMSYFLAKHPTKKDKYDMIYDYDKNLGKSTREIVFIQGIPVYTTHLRPYNIDNGVFGFEGTNELYNIMARVAYMINKSNLKIYRKTKPKNQLLYDLQMYYMQLIDRIQAILSQKKGIIRSSIGGRCNFTSRSVIVPGPDLRCDCIRLPYKGLVQLLEQRIINILRKVYSIPYHEAYKIWYRSLLEKDENVYKIIQSIIDYEEVGIPIIINRNPTINFGSIMQVYCIGINDNYTMSISLQILKFLGADFDGDTLNIMYLIDKDFIHQCEKTFNPRNTMYLSINDGRFDNRLNHSKDTIINMNTLRKLSFNSYTSEELENIRRLKEI